MMIKIAIVAAIVAVANAGLLLGDGGLGGGLIGGGYGGGLIGGGYGGGLVGGGLIGGGIGIGGKQTVDLYAPPKYEYKYAVGDGHTGDQKEQVEARVGDLTKSEYVTGEKDRITKVARVIAGSAPIVSKGYY